MVACAPATQDQPVSILAGSGAIHATSLAPIQNCSRITSIIRGGVMTTTSDSFMPLSVELPSDKQRLFVRYFTAILIDLVILNLFEEYWDAVTINSFTLSLLAAVLLQVLLKLTMAVEHRVAKFFKSRPGRLMTFLRFFCAWLVLFGSKFVILEALSMAFGDSVRFSGPLHGLVALIVVIVTMLIAEEAIVRLYRRLN
jgi:hypothetical protein